MLYTVSEVSKMLKVNRNYVYKLIKNGELEAVKIGSIKIKKDVLTKYINDNVINERGWYKMRLYEHQIEVLNQTKDRNKVAYYLDQKWV